MLTEIDTALTPIGAELERKRLRVPRYQRSYSWEEKHVNEYLSDLSEVIDRHGKEYFFGSIVLS